MKSNHELHKYVLSMLMVLLFEDVTTMLWLKLLYEYTKGCPIKVQH